MTNAYFLEARKDFHRQLLRENTLSLSNVPRSKGGGLIASNGDVGQKISTNISVTLAQKVAASSDQELAHLAQKLKGQSLGNQFEIACRDFIRATFKEVRHLRPGIWTVDKIDSRSQTILAEYEQYSHLADLKKLSEEYEDLATFLGNGYTVSPDVVIARSPESDEGINRDAFLVDDHVSLLSKLRQRNHALLPQQILHASVSCKFTMRSDRAQNTRTEALNLIRNRKGRSPHIVAVTAEPTPSRIASLALGTGDVDCVYHFALYELKETLAELGYEDALDSLNMMIDGKRLRDISDLPLDLAI